MGEIIGDHQRQIEENLLAFPRSNSMLLPILGKICLVPIKPFHTRQSRHLMPYIVYGNHIRDDAELSITHWRVGQEGVTAWPSRSVRRAYDTVLNELRAGRKSSHWIWFIFPQIAGLGHGEMAQQFALTSLDEAKAYLQHPVLDPRLRACTQLVLDVNGRSVEEIFGYPDHLKFRSCMTLFLTAATDNTIFKDALLKYFDGKPDQLTLDILAQQPC